MMVPDMAAIVAQQDPDLEGVNEMRRLASVYISGGESEARRGMGRYRASVVKPALGS